MSGTTTQTVAAFITLAMKICGAIGDGQAPSTQQTTDAFNILNMMLQTWNADRYLVYALQDVALTSTGAQSYTIGAGQSFNIARPTSIEGAYLRQYPAGAGGSFPVDFKVSMLTSYEDYAKISVKNLSSLSRYCFYDAAYPVGNVYFWPIPMATEYEMHLLVKTPLVAFTGLTEVMSLPPAYSEAVLYNLAVRLARYFQLPSDPDVIGLAKAALNTLRNSNAQVPRLSIDSTLYGGNASGQGWYNPFSDGN